MYNNIFVKPISWNVNNSALNYIELLGYGLNNSKIYVRFISKITYIIKLCKINNTTISNIIKLFKPVDIKINKINKIITLRTDQVVNYNLLNFSNIISVKQNPYGDLESFWEFKKIKPYEWISISNYKRIPNDYNVSIETDEEFISNINNIKCKTFPKLLFWNTVYSQNSILLIFFALVNDKSVDGYIIFQGEINTDIINEELNYITLIKSKDENDLLTKFIKMCNVLKPDCYIVYSEDTNELFKRFKINNVEVPKTLFSKLIINDIIDLFPCYIRLDAVNKIILNGLLKIINNRNLEDLIELIKSNETNKIIKFIKSSLDKSLIKLKDLYYIQYTIERVCNNLRVSIDTILRSSYEDIINKSIYNINTERVFKRKNISGLKKSCDGFFRDVYIYEYSELYRKIMLESNHYIISEFAKRLSNVSIKLIVNAFYTCCSKKLILILNQTLSHYILNNNSVIYLDPFIIKSTEPLNYNWLKQTDKLLCYLSMSETAYMSLNIFNNFETVGINFKFELLRDISKQYLKLLYFEELDAFTIPELKLISLDKFIINKCIKDLKGYTVIKYLITTNGPVILSELKPVNINYKYYTDKINKFIQELNSKINLKSLTY